MSKTLLKKFTEKHPIAHQPALVRANGDDMPTVMPQWFKSDREHEQHILREAAKDLLQPRPEAIARLLKMAKEVN